MVKCVWLTKNFGHTSAVNKWLTSASTPEAVLSISSNGWLLCTQYKKQPCSCWKMWLSCHYDNKNKHKESSCCCHLKFLDCRYLCLQKTLVFMQTLDTGRPCHLYAVVLTMMFCMFMMRHDDVLFVKGWEKSHSWQLYCQRKRMSVHNIPCPCHMEKLTVVWLTYLCIHHFYWSLFWGAVHAAADMLLVLWGYREKKSSVSACHFLTHTFLISPRRLKTNAHVLLLP